MAEKLNPITGLPEDNKPKITGIKKVGSSGAAKSQLSPMKELTKPIDISEAIPEEAPSKRVQLASYKDFTVSPDYNAIMDQYNKNFEFEKNKYLKQLDDEQNMLESTAAGVGKFLTKTIAGTGLGLMSTAWGVTKAIFTLDADAIVEDNIFSEAEEGVKEWADKAMPIYSDNPNYHQMSFMDKLMTEPGKLFGDEVGDALAFTASAIGQEAILSILTAATFGAAEPIQASATARLANRGYNIVKNLAKGKKYMKTADVAGDAVRTFKNMQTASNMANISNFMKNTGATAMGLGVATHYEAAIEARGTKDAMLQKYAEDIYNKYGREATDAEMQYAEKLADDAMWATYGMNAAILLPSHLIQFGSVFNKGYQGYKQSNKVMKQIAKDAEEFVTKHSQKSKLNKLLTYSYLTAKNPVTEAMEEFSQGVAHEGSLEYFGRQYSPEHNKNALNFFGTYGKAAVDYFGSTEGGNSMGIGAIVGLLGMPVGRSRGGWSGGVYGEISEYNKTVKAAESLIGKLNQADFKSALKENFKNSVVFSSLSGDKQQAASENDIFSFKNYEHDELFSYMYNRVKLGLKDDVLDDIKKLEDMSLEDFNKEFIGEGVEPYTQAQKDKAIVKAETFVESIEENLKAVDQILEYNLRLRKDKEGNKINKAQLEAAGERAKPYLVHAASTLQNVDIREQELVDRLTEISNFSQEEIDQMAIQSRDYAKLGKLSGLARKEKREGKLSKEDAALRDQLLKEDRINKQKYKDLLETAEEVDIEDLREIKGDFVDAQIGVDQTAFMELAKAKVEAYSAANPSKAIINKGEMMSILEDVAKLKNRRESYAKFYDYLATPEGIANMSKLVNAAEEALDQELSQADAEKAVELAKNAKNKADLDLAKHKGEAGLGGNASLKGVNSSIQEGAKKQRTRNRFNPDTPFKSLMERYTKSPALFDVESKEFLKFHNEKRPHNQISEAIIDNPVEFAEWVQAQYEAEEVDAAKRTLIEEFFADISDKIQDKFEQENPPNPAYDQEDETVEPEEIKGNYFNENTLEPQRLDSQEYEWEWDEQTERWVFPRDNDGLLKKAVNFMGIDWEYIKSGEIKKNQEVRFRIDLESLSKDSYHNQNLVGTTDENYMENFRITAYTLDKNGEPKVLGAVPGIPNKKKQEKYLADTEWTKKSKELVDFRKAVYKLLKDGNYLNKDNSVASSDKYVDLPYTSKVGRVGTGRINMHPTKEGGKISTVTDGEVILAVAKNIDGEVGLHINNNTKNIQPRAVKGLTPGGVYFLVESANGEYLPIPANTRFVTEKEADEIVASLAEAWDQLISTSNALAQEGKSPDVIKHKAIAEFIKDYKEPINEIVYLDIMPDQYAQGDKKWMIRQKDNTFSNSMDSTELKEYIMKRRSQVNYKKTNIGSYNSEIDGDKITTTLDSKTPIHSPTVTVNGFQEIGAKPAVSVTSSTETISVEAISDHDYNDWSNKGFKKWIKENANAENVINDIVQKYKYGKQLSDYQIALMEDGDTAAYVNKRLIEEKEREDAGKAKFSGGFGQFNLESEEQKATQEEVNTDTSVIESSSSVENIESSINMGGGKGLNFGKPNLFKMPDNRFEGTWDREKEQSWLRKNLPQVPMTVLDDMHTIFNNGGKYAWGVFQDAAMFIAENAGVGTVYHEAFHAVFNLYLTDNQKLKLYAEAQAETGISDDLTLEEWMSDKFQEYQVSGVMPEGIKPSTKNVFQRLWNFIKSIIGRDTYTLSEVFERMNNGKYSNKRIKGSFKGTRYSMIDGLNAKDKRERIDMLNSLVLDTIDHLIQTYDYGSVSEAINEARFKFKYADGQEVVFQGINAIYASFFQDYIFPSFKMYSIIGENNYDWNKIKQTKHYRENPEMYENAINESPDLLEHRWAQLDILNDQFFNKKTGKIELGPLVSLAIKDLARYNIKIKGGKVRKSDSNIEDINEEYSFEDGYNFEWWQKARAETSLKDTASFYIKHELSKFFDIFVDDKGVKQVATDSLGFNKRLRFDKVFNDLKHKLTTLSSSEEMIDYLRKNSKIKPYYEVIADKMEQDKRFRSAFFHSLATTLNNATMLRQESDEDGRTSYKIFDSNRNSPDKIIRNEWNAAYIYNQDFQKLTPEKAQQIFDNIEKQISKIKISNEDTLSYSRAKALSEELAKVGIILNQRTLRNEYESNPKSFISTFDGPVGLFNTVANKIKQGKNPFAQGKDAESQGLAPFIQMGVNARMDLYESAYMNAEGKQQFANVVPNHFSMLINALKNSSKYKDIINQYTTDPFYKKHKWLKELKKSKENRDLFGYTVLDGLRDDTGEAGKKYTRLSPKERMIVDLVLFHNESAEGVENKEVAKYTMPILADAAQLPIVQFKKYSNEEVLDSLMDVYDQETARIEKVKNEQQTLSPDRFIENYHINRDGRLSLEEQLATAKGLQYHYIVGAEGLTREQVREHIKKNILGKEVNEILDTMEQFSIKFQSGAHILPKTIQDINGFVESYVYNSFLANTNMLQLFSGDTAFYKNQVNLAKRNKQIANPGNLLDLAATGPTYKSVFLQDENVDSKFIEMYKRILKDDKEGLALATSFTGITQGDGQAYISIDRYKSIFEGAGLWTDEHENTYKKIKTGKKLDAKELSLVLQPIKPFVYGKRLDQATNTMVPIQNKNSEFVVIPQMLDLAESEKDKARIQKMLDLFEGDNKVDSIQFESAVKVGGRNLIKFDEINNDNIDSVKESAEVLNNSDYRIQLNVPEHHIDTTVLFGTQIRKLAISNIDPNTMYNIPEISDTPISGRKVIKLYQAAITGNINESYGEVMSMFYNPDGSRNMKKIRDLIQREIDDRGLTPKYTKAVELHGEEFALPLFFPLLSNKIESLLSSVFRNNITKQRIKGGSFVQVSDFTFSDQLKVTSKKTENGEVVEYMEALMPWWSREYFPTNADGEVDFQKIQKETPELLEAIGFRIPTEAKYSFPIIKVVGFTSPQQGGVIVLPADVIHRTGADFDVDKLFVMMPEFENINKPILGQASIERKYNNYIKTLQWSPQANKEIVRADIEDFDDLRSRKEFAKTFNYMWDEKDFTWKEREKSFRKVPSGEETKASRDNMLIDIIKGIMWNPAHQKEVLSHNTFKDLKGFLDKYGLDTSGNINMSLPSSQLELFKRNMAGNDLIGIFANHNSNHSILQHTNIAFDSRIGMRYGDKWITEEDENGESKAYLFTDLNRIYSPVDGKLITGSLAQFLAASVDNANDPVLSMLNINTFTADTVAMLVRTGMDLETVLAFINQPVIKRLAQEVENGKKESIAIDNMVEAFQKGLDKNFKKDGEKVDLDSKLLKARLELNKLKNKDKLTSSEKDRVKELEAMWDGEKGQKEMDYSVAAAFKHYYNLANSLSELTQASRADSKGSSDIVANELFLDRIDDTMKDKNFVKGTVAELFNGEAYEFIKEFTDKGVRAANQELKNYFPWVNSTFKEVKAKFEKYKGYKLSEKEIKLINSNLVSYIGSQFEEFNIGKEETNYLLKDLPGEFHLRKQEDEYFRDNPFIEALHYENKENVGMPRIITNNTASLDPTQKELIEEGFMELLADPNYNEMIRNLIKYSFVTQGFGFSPVGFNNLFDSEFYIKLKDSKGISFAEALRANQNLLAGNEEAVGDFVEMFLQNHHEKLGFTSKYNTSTIKKLSDSYYTTDGYNNPASGILTSFIVENELAIAEKPYITVSTSIGKLLYKKQAPGEKYAMYTLLSPTGKENVLLQYNPNIRHSYLEDNLIDITPKINYVNQADSKFKFTNIADLRDKQKGFDKIVHSAADYKYMKNVNELPTLKPIIRKKDSEVTPETPTEETISLQNDNVAKVKDGSKVITNRTYKIPNGVKKLDDTTAVETTYLGEFKVDQGGVYMEGNAEEFLYNIFETAQYEEDELMKTGKTYIDFDEFAQSEGFVNWNDFQNNNKFSRNFINGTESRHVHHIKVVEKVASTPTRQGTINVYWGQAESETSTRILSNLAPRKFTWEGREYGSVEHAYQSNKSGTFNQNTYDKYEAIGGYGKKIRGKGTVAEMKTADSLGLMKQLVVESFKQNPNSEAAKKLMQYENFTHNTNQLIDQAFLEGLKLAQKELDNLSQENLEKSKESSTFVKPAVPSKFAGGFGQFNFSDEEIKAADEEDNSNDHDNTCKTPF